MCRPDIIIITNYLFITVILVLVVSYCLLRNRDRNLGQKQRMGENDLGTRN